MMCYCRNTLVARRTQHCSRRVVILNRGYFVVPLSSKLCLLQTLQSHLLTSLKLLNCFCAPLQKQTDGGELHFDAIGNIFIYTSSSLSLSGDDIFFNANK